MQVRFKEHFKKGPVNAYLEKCVGGFALENVYNLGSTSRGQTLEALWIIEVKLNLNTQDTMRSRNLKSTIKI